MAKFTQNDIPAYSNLDYQALLGLGVIDDISDFQEILTHYQQLKQQFAPKKIFLILQDKEQAEYTSLHASDADEFCECSELDSQLYDLEIDSLEYEIAEQTQVYPKKIECYKTILVKPEFQKTLADCSEKMELFNDDDKKSLIDINENPLPIMDKEIFVLAGDFDNEPQKLALMINGYFAADFSPFENLAMIKLMADYGFEFIGLGAEILGFIKTNQFNAEKVAELSEKIAFVYHFDDETKTKMHHLLLTNNYAILSYWG